MKHTLLLSFFIFLSAALRSQTVTNLAANYHDGQVFLTWNNIPNADTGFYYIYKNTVPITASNIQSSTYLGRIPYNFEYDFRFTYSVSDFVKRFLVTNDNPFTVLAENQNLFVMNCTSAGQLTYLAVRCDFGHTTANWSVTPGQNSLTTGITQHLDPIRAYLQESLPFTPMDDEPMDVYIHYGGKVAVGGYPAMANEACLPFHFGIIKDGGVAANNMCYVKFHGGNGNYIRNCITANIDSAWKISFDDWIPEYNEDSIGGNTRWLGYHEGIDVYTVNDESPPPTSGIIKAYTYYRTNWELKWIIKNFPGKIDTTRIYLVGSSQGCGAVLLNCQLQPGKYASGQITDAKFNLNAPEDDNPDCKYNEGHSGRNGTRAIWGNEDSVNLKTDILKKGSTYYKIYDLTDMNYMFMNNKNVSLPFISSISGKNDNNTCWEEKPPVFATIQNTGAGGIYYWDLRGHSGGDNAWPPLSIPGMSRFRTTVSYPAFSNCSLDGDPGSTYNPNPPYFSGDDTGSLHGNFDWVDSTLKDNATSWEVKVFIFKAVLNDDGFFPAVLPNVASSDIIIRRAQNFKGFAGGTKLCWVNIHNGDTIQSGLVKQKYQGTVPIPIRIKGAKVFADGNVIHVEKCGNLRMENEVYGSAVVTENSYAYPNPFENSITVNFYLEQTSDVSIDLFNFLGERIMRQTLQSLNEGQHAALINTDFLSEGVYFIKVKSADGEKMIKVVKN